MSGEEDKWATKDSYTTLAANFEQPHKFADIFCAAAKDNKKIDGVLRENIKELIKNDNETRADIKALIGELEKEAWRAWLRKAGAWWFGLITLIIGMIAEAMIRKYLG